MGGCVMDGSRVIGGRRLGSVWEDTLDGHEQDVCPRCGDLKRAQAELCQACHLAMASEARQAHARARDLARLHKAGRRLVLEPGPGVDFEEALRAVVGSET